MFLGSDDNLPVKAVKQQDPVPPILEESQVEAEDTDQTIHSWQKSVDSSSDHRSPNNLDTKCADQPQPEVIQPFDNLLELLRSVITNSLIYMHVKLYVCSLETNVNILRLF